MVLNPLVNSTSSSDAYQSTAGKRTISQNLAIDPLDYYEQVKTKKNKSGQFSKDIPGPIDECEVEGKRAITYQVIIIYIERTQVQEETISCQDC